MKISSAWPKEIISVVLLLLLLLLAQGKVLAQFQLRCDGFSAFGGTSSSTSNNLLAIGGQPHPIEISSSADHVLNPGFIPCIIGPSIAPPPDSWTFITTDRNATIAVPAAINPSIGTQPLRTGDAVGVFFMENDLLICAGYSIWQEGQNMAITAWGDDPQTAVKDGFAENELIRYKIWDAYARREYNAMVTYCTGGPNYVTDGIYELCSLIGVTAVSHIIELASGWNMISSYVEPTNPALETMLEGIIPQMVIMKNGAGQIFWPALGINTIGQWTICHGYQIFMQSPATLIITGNQIVPEATPYPLAQGWNLAAYLRNSPMPIEDALASIADKLVIVKNNAGQVYWPALSINQIGDMMPGQGYFMNLTMAAILTYPPNSAASGSVAAKARESASNTGPATARHYLSIAANTGANATLLIETPALTEGDEVAIRTPNKMLVGSGVVRQGRVLITIWGDDKVTKENREGAVEGEVLALEVWSATEKETNAFTLSSLSDALTGKEIVGDLRYQANAVLVAKVAEVKEIPTSFSLSQNYPNPFNPSTVIKYGLPRDVKVKLEVYNVVGQRIAVLVDAKQKAGHHEVVFENSSLPSGVYFYRLQTDMFTQTMKMLMVR